MQDQVSGSFAREGLSRDSSHPTVEEKIPNASCHMRTSSSQAEQSFVRIEPNLCECNGGVTRRGQGTSCPKQTKSFPGANGFATKGAGQSSRSPAVKVMSRSTPCHRPTMGFQDTKSFARIAETQGVQNLTRAVRSPSMSYLKQKGSVLV